MDINISQLKEKLSTLNILVLGDLILDRYFWGTVERISPEAPVPIFELKEITYSLGGSANVAANLRGLGAKVELIGVVGDDDKGKILKKLAESDGIGTRGVLTDKERPTILKTRIIAQSQHLLRIDKEERKPLSEDISERIKRIYLELLPGSDGVILSDYAKGLFLDPDLCYWFIVEAKKRNKTVFVDPKSANWKKYSGATTITPNLKEFKEVLLREGLSHTEFDNSAEYLISKYGLEFLVVTLGKEGIYLYQPKHGGLRLPSQAREVYDVSGAGDTVIASLSTFYLAGLPLIEAVRLANICAGIVVGKVGTKPIYFHELVSFLKSSEEVIYGQD